MRTALLISSPVPSDLREQIEAGLTPRRDFLLLADSLGAQIIAPIQSMKRKTWLANVRRLATAAWAGFRARDQYDVIVSDTDHTGLFLALLFKLTRTRKRHILICHAKAAASSRLFLIRLLRLDRHIDRFVCYGPHLATLLQQGGIPKEQTAVIYHPADHAFWRPRPAPPERTIAAAGMTDRDYATLVEAVRGMDVRLVAAAFSPWVRKEATTKMGPPPANVTFAQLTPPALRDLYARAAFVAIPLHESPAQSGSLVAYEAMAMGKAVVSSRTVGQEAMGLVHDGITGLYVDVGDIAGWRRAIQTLLDDPQRTAAMGRTAREAVERGLNMDRYVKEMTDLITKLGTDGGARTSEDAAHRSEPVPDQRAEPSGIRAGGETQGA